MTGLGGGLGKLRMCIFFVTGITWSAILRAESHMQALRLLGSVFQGSVASKSVLLQKCNGSKRQ